MKAAEFATVTQQPGHQNQSVDTDRGNSAAAALLPRPVTAAFYPEISGK